MGHAGQPAGPWYGPPRPALNPGPALNRRSTRIYPAEAGWRTVLPLGGSRLAGSPLHRDSFVYPRGSARGAPIPSPQIDGRRRAFLLLVRISRTQVRPQTDRPGPDLRLCASSGLLAGL